MADVEHQPVARLWAIEAVHVESSGLRARAWAVVGARVHIYRMYVRRVPFAASMWLVERVEVVGMDDAREKGERIFVGRARSRALAEAVLRKDFEQLALEVA